MKCTDHSRIIKVLLDGWQIPRNSLERAPGLCQEHLRLYCRQLTSPFPDSTHLDWTRAPCPFGLMTARLDVAA